jgi:hypothetical protein
MAATAHLTAVAPATKRSRLLGAGSHCPGELTSHFVQISLRMHRQVGPLREVLPQLSMSASVPEYRGIKSHNRVVA